MTIADVQAATAPILSPAQAAAARLTEAQRAALKVKIGATAKKFEATFIAQMMGSMFKDVKMGGGETGEQFKSIMMDAMAKKISNNGGIGMAPSIQAEMLKLQGLS
jgi:Rod binding domain-containing protein